MKHRRRTFAAIALLSSLLFAQTTWGKTVIAMNHVEEQKLIEPAETMVVPQTDYIPVLMYHHFAIRDMGQGDGVVTTQADLEEQVRYLKELGYRFISLETLQKLLRRVEKEKVLYNQDGKDELGFGFNIKYICLTMDDGYRSNYELAFPIFQKYRIPASIFAVTDRITQQSGLKKISWEQGQTMIDSSFVKIYNHTANHVPVSEETEKEFLQEVEKGEIALQKYLDQTGCKALAFPNGQFTSNVQEKLKESGFDLLFTVKYGVITKQTSSYEIPRINVESGWSGQELLEHIEAAARRSFMSKERESDDEKKDCSR